MKVSSVLKKIKDDNKNIKDDNKKKICNTAKEMLKLINDKYDELRTWQKNKNHINKFKVAFKDKKDALQTIENYKNYLQNKITYFQEFRNIYEFLLSSLGEQMSSDQDTITSLAKFYKMSAEKLKNNQEKLQKLQDDTEVFDNKILKDRYFNLSDLDTFIHYDIRKDIENNDKYAWKHLDKFDSFSNALSNFDKKFYGHNIETFGKHNGLVLGCDTLGGGKIVLKIEHNPPNPSYEEIKSKRLTMLYNREIERDANEKKYLFEKEKINQNVSKRYRKNVCKRYRKNVCKHYNVLKKYVPEKLTWVNFHSSGHILKATVMDKFDLDLERLDIEQLDNKTQIIDNIVEELIKEFNFMIQNGIVHNDIKPANIFIKTSRDGIKISVCDFSSLEILTEDFIPTNYDREKIYNDPEYRRITDIYAMILSICDFKQPIKNDSITNKSDINVINEHVSDLSYETAKKCFAELLEVFNNTDLNDKTSKYLEIFNRYCDKIKSYNSYLALTESSQKVKSSSSIDFSLSESLIESNEVSKQRPSNPYGKEEERVSFRKLHPEESSSSSNLLLNESLLNKGFIKSNEVSKPGPGLRPSNPCGKKRVGFLTIP